MSSWREFLFVDKFKRSLYRRVALRCWVAAWLCALVLIISPVEHSAGQAAFLSLILVFVKPPAEPTVVFLAQSLLASIAVAVAWAWCILGGKLSLLARDHEQDQRVANATQGSVFQSNPNATRGDIEAELIIQVFEGAFLQAGPSAIWAVFLFIGIYFVFLIRAYNVRLFFLMVFCTVLLGIFATIGPLVPIFYLVPLSEIYLLPHVYYLASALFAVIFIFPTTVAETCSETLRTQVYSYLSVFENSSPGHLATLSSADTEKALEEHVAQRNGIIAQFDLIQFISPFLSSEISVGNASGKDINHIILLTRHISLTLGGFSTYLRHVKERRSQSTQSNDSSIEADSEADITKILTTLSESTATRHEAISKALRAICAFYDRQTDWKTTGFLALFLSSAKTRQERSATYLVVLNEALDSLTVSLKQGRADHGNTQPENSRDEKFGSRSSEADSTVSPEKRYDQVTTPPSSTPSSYLQSVYLEALNTTTARLITLLRLVIKIEQQPVRWWFPGKQNTHTLTDLGTVPGFWSLGRLPTKDTQTKSEKNGNATESFDPEVDGTGGANTFQALFNGTGAVPDGEDNPDVIPGLAPVNNTRDVPQAQTDDTEGLSPRRPNRLAGKIHRAFQWLIGTQSGFALKIGFLAIALACPAWITNNGTAKFYYDNKGVWALIAGLTAKGVYSSETTYGYIQRVIGAVIGGVVGLVMWYISTGSGRGNPYGMAVVCGVVMLYAVPHRLWHTNFLLTITATTTGAIVLGYSWADVTIPVAYNPGIGYSVFWRRLVLVLVGLTATWIIDLIPKPKTGREDLRKTYAKTTLALGGIVSAVLARLKDMPADPAAKRAAIDAIGSQVMSVHNKIRVSSVRILLAKLEPSFRREWSATHYLTLQRLQFELLDLIGVLALMSENMDAETRSRLLATPLFDSKQIVLLLNLFYFASSSLRTQQPLPHHLPSPKEIIAMSEDLDRQLSTLSGDEKTRQFVILGGAYIELCKRAEQLAQQCQLMFGTAMPHPI